MELKPLTVKNGQISLMPTTDTLPLDNIPFTARGFAKYEVQIGETYLIPLTYSSVISGPFELNGIFNLEGRFEII